MSTTAPRAAILAIGTELTTGQILNRNAQTLSERLVQLGFDIRLHETVPDDRPLMRGALDHASTQADILVVTGGLGPTTDDFTRDVIADWAGAPLEYREESWTKIVNRLTERGIEVAESNRQQSYFPRGSVVLENLEGTADGFRLEVAHPARNLQILVLPGPPREIAHLWETQAAPWLLSAFPHARAERLLSWKTIGKSESALGEIVEKAVQGLDVKTGYRASMPYIEVKIWLPAGSPSEVTVTERIEAAIGDWIITRGNEDLLQKFFSLAQARTGTLGLTFLDLATGGTLAERLIAGLRTPLGSSLKDRIEILSRQHERSESEHLPESASEWLFGVFPDGLAAVISPDGAWKKEIVSPYTSHLLKDRLLRYRTERALQFFCEVLATR